MKEKIPLENALAKAMRLIKVRDRSAGEMRQKLRDAGFEAAVIGDCLAWLIENSYIDDARFAQEWVSQKAASRKMGRAKVRRELAAKGIDPALAEEALSGFFDGKDEAALALDFLRRKYRKGTGGLVKEKLLALLARNGYSYEAAGRAAVLFLENKGEGEDEE